MEESSIPVGADSEVVRDTGPEWRAWLGWRAWIGAAVGLAVSFVFFSATGHDDAHMTYWAAHTLSDVGEILNYSGERVEQSSSLLHTVVLALLHVATSAPLPAIGYYAGIAFALLAVARLGALGRRAGLSLSIGHFALAASVPAYGYWALGGLETSLAAWLLVELAIVWIDAGSGRSAFAPRAWLVTLGTLAVRPEMVFVVTAAWGGALVCAWWARPGDARSQMQRAWIRSGGVLAASFALLVAFRWFYFGAIFPQPVAAKTGEHEYLADLAVGLNYLAGLFSGADHAALALALIVAALAAWRGRGSVDAVRTVPLALAGAYLAFVAAVGGDWMELGRFVAPAIPLLAFLLFGLIERLEPVPGGRRAALAALLLLQWLGTFERAAHESTGRPLWKVVQVDPIIREHVRGIDVTWSERARMENCRDALAYGEISAIVGAALEHRERLTILSGQAGMVMYYLCQEYGDRIDFIDRFGLTSRRLMALADEEQIPRGAYGLWMTTKRYLELAGERADEGLVPDIVFDIRPRDRQEAKAAGYVLMYDQSGAAASWWEPRSEPNIFTQGMLMTEFIAVEAGLAAEMALPGRPVKFNWDQAKQAYFEGALP